MAWLQVLIVLLAVAAANEASKSPIISCPEGYNLVGKDCYFVSAESHTGSSAQRYCEMSGGYAAIIASQAEMDLVRGVLPNTTVYVSVGEPDSSGSEDCVVADIDNGITWKNTNCTELHPVLCKATSFVSEKEQLSCGVEEHLFGGACFWVSVYGSMSTLYTWSMAQDECRRRGLQMASVHSQEEQDFLWGLSGGNRMWIGLTDKTTEGEFEWTDWTPLDFQKWGSGEPLGGELYDCVFMNWAHDGAWSDALCTASLATACRGPAS